MKSRLNTGNKSWKALLLRKVFLSSNQQWKVDEVNHDTVCDLDAAVQYEVISCLVL
jgi:hypothetical protein